MYVIYDKTFGYILMHCKLTEDKHFRVVGIAICIESHSMQIIH